jgi:DNA-3-methyladenine glycosylase II
MNSTGIAQFVPPPPFDATRTFAAAGATHALGHALLHDGPPRYRRALRLGGRIAVLELAASSDGAALDVRVLAADGPLPDGAAQAAAGWMIDPAFSLAPFYQFAQQHPILAETCARLHGLRLLRYTSVFEALLVTVIEQQIALRAAQRAERWLAATYGSRLIVDGVACDVLPTPERMASLTLEQLAPLRITFVRMRRLLEIARMQAEGVLDLEALPHLPPPAMYAALRELRGVGHWTAAWTMIRAAGHYLYFGRADVALRAAVHHYLHGQRGRMDAAAMDALFAGYGPFAGLASVMLILRWAADRDLSAPHPAP